MPAFLPALRRAVALTGASLLLTTGALTTGVVLSGHASAETRQVSANGGLNVRSGPSTNHPVIGGLANGARVETTGAARDGFTPVAWGGRTGWVASRYLSGGTVSTAPSAGTARTTAYLNVRSGPGTSHAKVGVLAKGATVQLTGTKQGGWTEINHAGTRRWVSSAYLTTGAAPAPAKPAPAPSAPAVGTTCKASYYHEGQMTANGERFDPNAMTAAHRTYAFNTRVKVTNPATGQSVTVRINDRGPFISGRCIDLSRAAFDAIGNLDSGVMNVVVQPL